MTCDDCMTEDSPQTTAMTKPSAKRVLTRQDIDKSLKRLDRIATLMDDQFEIPIIKRRVGLDPIIGLIPGGGDWVVWAVSVLIFWQAYKLNVPMKTLMKMAGNISVDLLGGYVPGVGDLFDAVYKANKRNVELIHEHFGGAPELGAQLPAVIPERALTSPKESAVVRFAVVTGVIVLLLALASGPIVLLYFLFSGA